MPNYKVYKDPQRPMDLRVAFWLLYFNARIIPGKVCREKFIDQVVADLISEPDAYESGLFLNVIHCAFVGAPIVARDEICMNFKRKRVFAISVLKEGIRKAKSDIYHLEINNNKKKSMMCKGYILCREIFDVFERKRMEQQAQRNGDL